MHNFSYIRDVTRCAFCADAKKGDTLRAMKQLKCKNTPLQKHHKESFVHQVQKLLFK
jgi:hypothetical protein